MARQMKEFLQSNPHLHLTWSSLFLCSIMSANNYEVPSAMNRGPGPMNLNAPEAKRMRQSISQKETASNKKACAAKCSEGRGLVKRKVMEEVGGLGLVLGSGCASRHLNSIKGKRTQDHIQDSIGRQEGPAHCNFSGNHGSPGGEEALIKSQLPKFNHGIKADGTFWEVGTNASPPANTRVAIKQGLKLVLPDEIPDDVSQELARAGVRFRARVIYKLQRAHAEENQLVLPNLQMGQSFVPPPFWQPSEDAIKAVIIHCALMDAEPNARKMALGVGIPLEGVKKCEGEGHLI